jgi:hypothetical protein
VSSYLPSNAFLVLQITYTSVDDAAAASAKVKGQLPGGAKEAKTQAKLSAEEAGQKFDAAVSLIKVASYPMDVG